MTNDEKLNMFEKFDEGTELTDGVYCLIKAANILGGIGCDHEEAIIIILIEKLIRDYCGLGRNRELEWKEYNEIDPEVYSYVLGGAKKMTEDEFIV